MQMCTSRLSLQCYFICQQTEDNLPLCEPALTDLFCTAVRCFMQPAICIYGHFVPTVLADMHRVGDRFQDRQQALYPHALLPRQPGCKAKTAPRHLATTAMCCICNTNLCKCSWSESISSLDRKQLLCKLVQSVGLSVGPFGVACTKVNASTICCLASTAAAVSRHREGCVVLL